MATEHTEVLNVTKTKTILLPFLAIAMGTLVLGGCTNNKLKEENAALREQQNMTAEEVKELNQKLEMEQAARREAESKKAAAEQEAIAARAAAAAAPQPMPQMQPPASDFGGGRRGSSGGGERDVIITVAGDVAFGPGQATLTAAGRRELDQVAREINRKHAGHRIRVEGYTDSDPVRKSKWGSNQALSQARADAVEKYLISKGISSSRISAVGMGSKNPKSTKAASRRVEIVIVGG